MSDKTDQLSGIVLQMLESGEKYQRISIFSPLEGLITVMFRRSRKSPNQIKPDLFDSLECTLSSSSRDVGIPFVRECRIVLKRSYLALDHRIFFAAAEIAKIFLHNGIHILDSVDHYNLLENSLGSLGRGHPQATRIKTLYLFAKLEGLPVKQAWFPGLNQNLQSKARFILGSSINEDSNFEDAEQILESLILWLNSETELKC